MIWIPHIDFDSSIARQSVMVLLCGPFRDYYISVQHTRIRFMLKETTQSNSSRLLEKQQMCSNKAASMLKERETLKLII